MTNTKVRAEIRDLNPDSDVGRYWARIIGSDSMVETYAVQEGKDIVIYAVNWVKDLQKHILGRFEITENEELNKTLSAALDRRLYNIALDLIRDYPLNDKTRYAKR